MNKMELSGKDCDEIREALEIGIAFANCFRRMGHPWSAADELELNKMIATLKKIKENKYAR